jgi:hypothetical protein
MIFKAWNPMAECWCYIDKVARVSNKKSGGCVVRPRAGSANPEDIEWIDTTTGDAIVPDFIIGDGIKACAEAKDSDVRVGLIGIDLRDGEQKVVVFMDKAFLLNDDGKTIDRL